jgi:hypothetical protein
MEQFFFLSILKSHPIFGPSIFLSIFFSRHFHVVFFVVVCQFKISAQFQLEAPHSKEILCVHYVPLQLRVRVAFTARNRVAANDVFTITCSQVKALRFSPVFGVKPYRCRPVVGLWIRHLVAGLSPRRRGVGPSPFHLRFIVGRHGTRFFS